MKSTIGQKALLAGLCFAILAAPALASTYYLPQLAVGVAGDLQVRTLVTLSNPSSNTSNATLVFATYKDDGSPWFVNWEARGHPEFSGSQDYFSFALLPGASITMLAKSTGGLATGWMGGRSTEPIVITLRYSVARIAAGVTDPLWEVGVLPSAGLNEHFLFVGEGASDWAGCTTSTALAVANTSGNVATLTLELFAYGGGSPLRTRTLAVPGYGHVAQFLPEIFTDVFSAAAFRGMLRISSNTPVAVTTLQNWATGSDSVYAAAGALPSHSAESSLCFEQEPTELTGQGEIVFLPAEIVGVLNSSTDGADTDVFRIHLNTPGTLAVVSLADLAGSALVPQVALLKEGGQTTLATSSNLLSGFGASGFQVTVAESGWYSLRVTSPTSDHGRRAFYRIFVNRN